MTANADSRVCCCLWSVGNVEQAIADNHATHLDRFWEKGHFFVITGEEGNKKISFSVCRLLWSLTVYPLGMVGYLCDMILKIVLFTGNLFILVLSLCCCNAPWRRDRAILVVDNLTAVGICLVGVVVPPVAYRLDKIAQKKMTALLF